MAVKHLAFIVGLCLALAGFCYYVYFSLDLILKWQKCGENGYKAFQFLGSVYCVGMEQSRIEQSTAIDVLLFLFDYMVMCFIIISPILILMGIAALLFYDDNKSKRLDAYLSKLDFSDVEIRRVFAPYVVKFQKHDF